MIYQKDKSMQLPSCKIYDNSADATKALKELKNDGYKAIYSLQYHIKTGKYYIKMIGAY